MARGRPKGSTQRIKPHDPISIERKAPAKRDIVRKKCSCCGKEQTVSKFYKIPKSDYVLDGLSPYCKECTVNSCLNEDGFADVDKLKTMLRMMNRPFIETVWAGSVEEDKDDWRLEPEERGKLSTGVIQKYFKSINSLPQYVALDWEQGEQLNNIKAAESDGKSFKMPEFNEIHAARKTKEKQEERIYTSLDDEDDDISQETIARFGEGFTRFQYKQFEKKYKFLSQSYGNYSALHEEALIQYVRYRVLEEEAVANVDVDSAEKWGGLANKAAAAAKINPSQIKDTDDGGGFSFSEFNAAIERASDVIRILPRFKETALDSPDICLYTYIQYMCAMLGKPLVEYKDIYKFYDDSVENYIETTGDPYKVFTKKNREAVKKNRTAIEKFLDVPKSNQASYFNGDDK